jgi:hypothetical protein
VQRLRQTVSPQGDLTEELDETMLSALSPTELETEAESFGLGPAARHHLAATPDHVGSVVVVLEAPA